VLLFNKGINLIKLISKQIHNIIHELEDINKNILINIRGIKINLQ
jgi:hypothetical protein